MSSGRAQVRRLSRTRPGRKGLWLGLGRSGLQLGTAYTNCWQLLPRSINLYACLNCLISSTLLFKSGLTLGIVRIRDGLHFLHVPLSLLSLLSLLVIACAHGRTLRGKRILALCRQLSIARVGPAMPAFA